jgi:hypothetical protein
VSITREELSVRVGSLEQARREHGEVGTAVDELASFLDSDLVPYLRAEEGVLYGAPAGAGQADGILGCHSRISRQRLSEHDMLSQAASTLARARAPANAVGIADSIQSAFGRHIAHEDATVMSLARTAPGTAHPGARRSLPDLAQPPAPGTIEAGLATCLQNAIAYEHARIARQIASSAREIRDDPSQETAVYERIIAALSRHASVMALYLYPAADDVLPPSDHDVTRQLRTELREAEKTMLRLERILHGDALENPCPFTDLWAAITQISQTHSSLEEALVRRLAHHLPASRVASLRSDLRTAELSAPTRPHPAAPAPAAPDGWPPRSTSGSTGCGMCWTTEALRRREQEWRSRNGRLRPPGKACWRAVTARSAERAGRSTCWRSPGRRAPTAQAGRPARKNWPRPRTPRASPWPWRCAWPNARQRPSS